MSHSEPHWKPGSARAVPGYSESEEGTTIMSMVTMLSCQDASSAQRILLAMAGSPESCQALRQAGCISLLIQVLHPINIPTIDHPNPETKLRAAQTLRNVVEFNCDEKMKRKEMKILKLLENLRTFIESLKAGTDLNPRAGDKHPIPSSTALMKLSLDREHRLAMCPLGAIHTLADLIQTDHSVHGITDNPECMTMRRLSCMTLTNLTVGNKPNKLLLGSMREFMTALVAQLDSSNEDVCQIVASVLRNLSWHASSALKTSLVQSNSVRKLMLSAIKAKKETTLQAALSALWNLSAHSHTNKLVICQTPDAIEFLVSLLESSGILIVENAGGILTNISIIATTDESTGEIFRSCGILEILLDHLQSPSILVVGNACGMLWHLSNCEFNQQKLLKLGAVRRLRVLAGSKHERVRHGACSTLRNILNERELPVHPTQPDHTLSLGPPSLTEQHHQPIDLRTTTTITSTVDDEIFEPEPEPLNLSIHSSKSSPIHTVSATEFGLPGVPVRNSKVPFLNPPLQHKNASKYDSPLSYNSCPEFVRYLQPAHMTSLELLPPSNRSNQNHGPETTEDTTVNYSLHFPESIEDPDPIPKDTVTTYHYEGTPLNFSTSNSMTDLTLGEKTKLKPIIETDTMTGDDDLSRKYSTESTPAIFSRASSLSSITSNLQGGENKAEYFDELKLPDTSSLKEGQRSKRNVTFSAADTPLMFSRTSSVNSLESVDINYDDTGSLASEFSRRVSEAVSPSELPDSPRQIEPPPPMRFELASENCLDTDGDTDTVKVFAQGESCAVSGAVSARSLSPLTIEDETTFETIEERMKVEGNNDKSPSAAGVNNSEKEQKESKPWHAISTASSLSDLVEELEKEMKDFGTEKPPLTPPPPPLPPKPIPKPKPEQVEHLYVDVPSVSEPTDPLLALVVPPGRVPKSKSETGKLNTKGMKMSTSYHENLKREHQLDPDLAALIMKGKSRVKGTNVKNLNGKPSSSLSETEKKRTKGTVEVTTILVKKDDDHYHGDKEKVVLDQSVKSIGSEWNDDTSSLSVPSMSISTAFKLAQSDSTAKDELRKPTQIGILEMSNLILQSTVSNIEPIPEPSPIHVLKKSKVGTVGTDSTTSNLFNQKPPPEFHDLDNSMMSVASLKTEAVSIGPLEEGMRDLSLCGETYTVGAGSDFTDAEDSSCFEDTESFDSKLHSGPGSAKGSPKVLGDRFLTYTTKKHMSPKQKRKDDPTRYLTRTIVGTGSPHQSPRDTNGNPSVSPFMSTFRSGPELEPGTKTARVVKPGSTDSSPNTSPKGIRGRRKPLYSSLPPQKRNGPPVPPKPACTGVGVRPTRTSELRAASSRETSPKSSNRHSSNGSLNQSGTAIESNSNRKTPPKPPVRTTPATSSFRNFAVVRAVRNSSSSIGFATNETGGVESAYSTLPKSLKVMSPSASAVSSGPGCQGSKESKVRKLSTFWNQLMKKEPNGNSEEKRHKFGFHFGRKKKQRGSTVETNWIACADSSVPALTNRESDGGVSTGVTVNDNLGQSNGTGPTAFASRMTPV